MNKTCRDCDHHYNGECRRFPPRAVVDDKGVSWHAAFPEVKDDFFCGEFTLCREKMVELMKKEFEGW